MLYLEYRRPLQETPGSLSLAELCYQDTVSLAAALELGNNVDSLGLERYLSSTELCGEKEVV